MPVQKTCGHCATPFLVPPRRSETVKFCSRECKTNAGRITIICAACGGSFERVKHLGLAKYCSTDCFHSATKGASLNVHRRERHYQRCEVCSVLFRVTFSRIGTARFCSRTCQSKSPTFRSEASEAQRGARSHLWKGGLYKRGTGYVRIKGGELGHKEFRFVHRFVVETAMLEMEPNHPFLVDVGGRKKLSEEIEVHHIDRDRSNNAFSNLLAVTKTAHARLHHKNRTPDPWECWPYSHIVQSTSSKGPTMEITDTIPRTKEAH